MAEQVSGFTHYIRIRICSQLKPLWHSIETYNLIKLFFIFKFK